MAVGAPFNTAYQLFSGGTTTKDLTMTINSGESNTCLVVDLAWATAAATISSVTWDPTGANQSLTAVNAVTTTGTTYSLQSFYLVNPTPGTSKIVRVVLSTSVTDCMVGASVYAGVDQTTPTANFTTTSGALSRTVTATSGDATRTVVLTSNTLTATDKTEIWRDQSGTVISGGGDYALATGNTTHTWTGSGAVRLITGFTLQQAAAGGDPEGSLAGGKLIGGGLLLKGVLVP